MSSKKEQPAYSLYRDDVIEFLHKNNHKVVRPIPFAWHVKKGNFSLDFDANHEQQINFMKERMVTVADTLTDEVDKLGNKTTYIKTKELVTRKGKLIYSGCIRQFKKQDGKALVVQGYSGVIVFDGIGFFMRVSDYRLFSIDEYLYFFDSMKLNPEKLWWYLEHFVAGDPLGAEEFARQSASYAARIAKTEKEDDTPIHLSSRAVSILAKMDADTENPYRFRPDLEHGYFYTAGSRITLFGDKNRWAFVFEKSGYSNRGGSVDIELNYFGNCLTNLETAGMNGMFVCNAKNFTSFETADLCEDIEIVSPDVETVEICGQAIPIPHDPKIYREHNIELNDPDEISIVELTRLLNELHPELFRATEEELRTCLPDDLPQVMVINHWHHESVYEEQVKPMSECEVYRQIAEVLATLDPKKWKPKKKPNNDWRNWPEAGGL